MHIRKRLMSILIFFSYNPNCHAMFITIRSRSRKSELSSSQQTISLDASSINFFFVPNAITQSCMLSFISSKRPNRLFVLDKILVLSLCYMNLILLKRLVIVKYCDSKGCMELCLVLIVTKVLLFL